MMSLSDMHMPCGEDSCITLTWLVEMHSAVRQKLFGILDMINTMLPRIWDTLRRLFSRQSEQAILSLDKRVVYSNTKTP